MVDENKDLFKRILGGLVYTYGLLWIVNTGCLHLALTYETLWTASTYLFYRCHKDYCDLYVEYEWSQIWTADYSTMVVFCLVFAH